MRKEMFKNDVTRKRTLLIALALVMWMLVIIWRLAWVQIARHNEFIARAERNQSRVQKTEAPRGDIVDRNGNQLAMSVQTDALFADLDMIAKATPQQRERIVETLAPLLGFSKKDLANKLQAPPTRKDGLLWLKQQLEPALSRELQQAVRKAHLPGIGFMREAHRHYPNETLASHLIGAVTRGENETGIEGLEKYCQTFLTGIEGKIEYSQDATGEAFERFDTPARPGARVVTTIDMHLQHKVEVLLAEALQQTRAKSATVIVLDPSNGEVLTLANAPAFNPNERLQELTDAHRFKRKNRALTDIYEPGSVFKLVAYAGALEEGVIHPDSMIDCQGGVLHVAGRAKPVHDSHLGTGVVTAAEAFAKSSNVGAIKTAMQLGKGRLVDYIRKFGFLSNTGIELPENKGTILGEGEWKYGAIGVVPIGQGVTVTALQAVTAYAAIANRGVWSRPHLVKEIVSADGGQVLQTTQLQQRRVLRAETADQLAQMMRHVVGQGTGRAAGKLAGYTAAGKTGTAQKAVPGRGYADNKYIASFVGFVPATQPRFAIIVVLDEPQGAHQGGQVCAPIFNLIAEAALVESAVVPDDETFRATLAQMATQVTQATPPPQKAVPLPAATPMALVSSKPGAAPSRRDHVIAQQTMPDLTGKGLRAVMQTCTKLQMRMQLDGAGIAVSQSPVPGATIKPGALCQVKFQ
jgi:cell division protein FtsI/penicillin-binding protein 2